MSVLCPVAVAQNSVRDEYQPETAAESHLLLLKQKKYCDVTFTFPSLPNRIEAHEFCLKARSPVFAKIFRMRKSGNVQRREIKISESTPEIFQQFLEFIYADKLAVNIAGALELIQLSRKYKVRPLTKKCEELLKTDIPFMDSVKVFETARRYGRRDLMDRAGPIMVKSFTKLARTDSLARAEEETLVNLLECDDLAVKEVGLFQFILDWGRRQVGNCGDDGRLKKKLKNLIPKIRYTNMAPHEFTKVVVPAGLLSVEETISVYSYLCADEITRRDLKTEFNTNRRKMENKETDTKFVRFYYGFVSENVWFPAMSKQSISFHVHRSQVARKGQPDYFLGTTAITAIGFWWPALTPKYSGHHVMNFNVSVVEYSGPAKGGSFTIKFQKKLLNCLEDDEVEISVEPPVELVSGRTYSVIVEDHSTSDLMDSFRKDPFAYDFYWDCFFNREANVDFEDVSLTLSDIRTKTDWYAHAQELSHEFEEFTFLRRIAIGLM